MEKYDYYVLLNFRSTKVFSLEEIVEYAIIIINAETLQVERTIHEYVKPSILQFVSAQTNLRSDLDYKETFYHHLDGIVNIMAQFLDKKILMVTLSQDHLSRLLPGQAQIEERIRDLNADHNKFLSSCRQWCNLKNVFQLVSNREIQKQPWEKSELNHLWRCLGLPYDDIYKNCLIEAREAVDIIRILVRKTASERLFPTTSLVQKSAHVAPYLTCLQEHLAYLNRS